MNPNPNKETPEQELLISLNSILRRVNRFLFVSDSEKNGDLTIGDAALLIRSLFATHYKAREAKYRGEIAHAIGYAQGLGYPDEYLEKHYPEISKESKS